MPFTSRLRPRYTLGGLRARAWPFAALGAFVIVGSLNGLRPMADQTLRPEPIQSAAAVPSPPAAPATPVEAQSLAKVIAAVRRHSLATAAEADQYVQAMRGVLDRLGDPYAALLVGGG